jgi:hypothetical protein
MLPSSLVMHNIYVHMNITTPTLSLVDGSTATMLFTHGCSGVNKFSAVTEEMTESPRYID